VDKLYFANPVDGGKPLAEANALVWRDGFTFGDLTLAPQGVPLGEPFLLTVKGMAHLEAWIVEGDLRYHVVLGPQDDTGVSVGPS
jgi:hypothetical protein